LVNDAVSEEEEEEEESSGDDDDAVAFKKEESGCQSYNKPFCICHRFSGQNKLERLSLLQILLVLRVGRLLTMDRPWAKFSTLDVPSSCAGITTKLDNCANRLSPISFPVPGSYL
jgi:hypothetical protein